MTSTGFNAAVAATVYLRALHGPRPGIPAQSGCVPPKKCKESGKRSLPSSGRDGRDYYGVPITTCKLRDERTVEIVSQVLGVSLDA